MNLRMKTTPCKGCGKQMIFAKIEGTGSGYIPLDPSAPVYQVKELEDGTVVAIRDKGALVSHFKTCRDANKF